MPNLLRFWLFFLAFPFPAPPYIPLPILSPLSPLTSPLIHFTPPLPFSKEVNKKFSYRGQNALRVVKPHERNADSEHTLYLFVF